MSYTYLQKLKEYTCNYCGLIKPSSKFDIKEEYDYCVKIQLICSDCKCNFKILKKEYQYLPMNVKKNLCYDVYTSCIITDKSLASLLSVSINDIVNWRIEFDIKRCTGCKEIVKLSSLYDCSSSKDGKQYRCYGCQLQYMIENGYTLFARNGYGRAYPISYGRR